MEKSLGPLLLSRVSVQQSYLCYILEKTIARGVFLRVSNSENKCPSCQFNSKACINEGFTAIVFYCCLFLLLSFITVMSQKNNSFRISEVHIACSSISVCMIFAAMQHTMVSTCGCCAPWAQSSSICYITGWPLCDWGRRELVGLMQYGHGLCMCASSLSYV